MPAFEPRIHIVSLGVQDFDRALAFYRDALGFPLMQQQGDWCIFETGGARLALYPRDKLAADVDPSLDAGDAAAFAGVTLAHNVGSRDEVDAVIARVEAAGGTIRKRPVAAAWGGYSAYFADPDGFFWEVAFGPNTTFDASGELR